MNAIKIALIGGLVGMFGYGISDFFAKKTIDKIGEIRSLIFVQLIGAGFIALYLPKDPSLPNFSAENFLYLFIITLINTISYFALYRAFKIGKISIVSPISSSFSIMAAFISFFFFGETFSSTKIFALGFVIFGVFLTAVNFKDLKDGLDKKDFAKGVPEALVAFFGFGIQIPFWDKFIEGPGWVVWTILARLLFVLILLSYSFLMKQKISLRGGPKIIYWLLFVAFFEAAANFGGNWAYNASANTTSIITSVVSGYPLITASLAFVFLKERLAKNQYLGIFLILLGLMTFPFI